MSDSDDRLGVSRRSFLKSAGLGGVATAAAGALAPTDVEGQMGPAVIGPGDVPVTLTVNGARLDLKIEPRVTLLDALRNRADLTGNKRVCDRGSCGACTMIVDGRTVYSCSTLAIDVQGKQIRTVDGLAKGDALHPVQQAFCDADALMCGFCTPGFVVATVALLEKYPNATPEQARKELDGNICRCGTFVRVLAAAGHARAGVASRDSGFAMTSPEMLESPRVPTSDSRAPKYAWPQHPALLSTPVKRLDGPDKVTGRAHYTYDITRPGMIYGKMVRSPYPHARITSIDVTRAQTAPGVKAVLAYRKQGDELLYQGDPVAAVAADTEERARDAARLIRVRYEPLPHVSNETQAFQDANAPKWSTTQANTRAGVHQETGDLDAGFKQGAHLVEQTYSTHVITHVCLETHGTVCEWDGDKLTAWVSTQGVHQCADGFAQSLGIPRANVRVVTQYMGGGFGSKFAPDAQGIICAKLAKMANAPVKLMLERKEEHLDTGNRPSAFAHIKASVAQDGTLTAFDGNSWGTGGAGAGSNFPLPYLYRFPNRRRTHTDVYINAGQQRAMRAPGHPQGCFLTEILMDELSDPVKMDPIEFRIKNAPPLAPNAQWVNYFRDGARRFGWDKRHATGDPTPGPIKTGMGVSAHLWGGAGRGSQAHVDIHNDGSVVVKCGTQDLGTGTRTLVAIVAAETFGLPVSAVKPEIGDTLYPFSGGSGGSTTAASVTPAIRVTCVDALNALFAKVAPTLGVSADQLVAEGGRIHVAGNAARGVSWKDACKSIGTEPISVDGKWQDGLSGAGTSGVQFAEVAVDMETGIVRIKRILAMQDCGLIVDRLTAESQAYGGVVAAINFALFEDRILDRETGQMVNPNMEWYLLAGMSDVPQIDIVLHNMPERGVIGIGEPPTVSTASAIANAVRNATGATIRSLPLHPHKVLAALEQERAGGTN